jgi:hypothetical protein
MTAETVVRSFWNAMATNDFYAASEWLSSDFEGYWPQSKELIRGREAFARINTAYPAKGRWRFDLQQLVVQGAQVVTDVAITDGDIQARAVTFHFVREGLIAAQLEYWPDPFPAPEWRAGFVEVVERPHFPD